MIKANDIESSYQDKLGMKKLATPVSSPLPTSMVNKICAHFIEDFKAIKLAISGCELLSSFAPLNAVVEQDNLQNSKLNKDLTDFIDKLDRLLMGVGHKSASQLDASSSNLSSANISFTIPHEIVPQQSLTKVINSIFTFFVWDI